MRLLVAVNLTIGPWPKNDQKRSTTNSAVLGSSRIAPHPVAVKFQIGLMR